METTIETNADLYDAVLAMLSLRKDAARSLECYLLRLLELARVECQDSLLHPIRFAQLLDAAFEGIPTARTPKELQDMAGDETNASWLRTLAQQISDLREMARAGTLQDEYRYFGIDAPGGARWYNFDPHTFVECGMTGSIGGWEPSSNSNRQLVPGLAAYLDDQGQMQAAMPEDLQEDAVAIDATSWEDFTEFLCCGQYYE